MFLSEGIVFMAVFCAVNAAVTVNIYDDGSNEVGSLKACDYIECDQLCRRIGFPGGACVGDRCKCDIIRKDFVSNHIIKNRQNLKYLEHNEIDECTGSSCEKECQDQNYLGGSCDVNRCKCIKEKKTNSSTCDDLSCYITCFGLDFIDGICQGDVCICF